MITKIRKGNRTYYTYYDFHLKEADRKGLELSEVVIEGEQVIKCRYLMEHILDSYYGLK